METMVKTVVVGIGATFCMDIWSFTLKTFFNITSLNYALVGRWIGHFPKGKFIHQSILKAPAVPYEALIGWFAHYFIGISFAFVLVGLYKIDWLHNPTLFPAILIGLITIVAPFFIMQPSFGLGFAASNTPDPNIVRLKSLMAHTIYGLGLYVSAILINYFIDR